MSLLEVELDTKVRQFIESEVSRRVKEEVAGLKEFWEENFLFAQAKSIWEKEWDKEWQEIWS